MYNYILGEIKKFGDKTFIINKNLGIGFEVIYKGNKKNGEFFLYPYFEQNLHTYINFCFSEYEQKQLFEKLIKIPGIGPKTAYNISTISMEKLKSSLDKNDINFFTKIPGIGPKTAKRIIIELKENFNKIDLEKINVDEKLFKQISKTLVNLGYNKNEIIKLLQQCPIEFKEENLQQIIKWLLDNID